MGSTKFHEKFNSDDNQEEEEREETRFKSENKDSPQGFFITKREIYIAEGRSLSTAHKKAISGHKHTTGPS